MPGRTRNKSCKASAASCSCPPGSILRIRLPGGRRLYRLQPADAPLADRRRADHGRALLGACPQEAQGGLRPRRLGDRRRGLAPNRRVLPHRWLDPQHGSWSAPFCPARPHRATGDRVRTMAAAPARPDLVEATPGREVGLHPPPMEWPADLPPRRSRRDRLQCPLPADCFAIACRAVVREPDPPYRIDEEKCAFCRPRRRRPRLGPRRVAHRAVKINGVGPFASLKATLEAIAAGQPASRVDELLPWNLQPSS